MTRNRYQVAPVLVVSVPLKLMCNLRRWYDKNMMFETHSLQMQKILGEGSEHFMDAYIH